MRPRKQIHWQTPILLLSSLLVGCCLAVGHHAFYQSLNTSKVDGDQFKVAGWRTSRQQLVSVAGVMFAFVVKASLILCASIAYMQLFFRALQIGEFRLKTLDQWFAALGDIRSLICIATIFRYPVMTLIASTAWLLPLAAVFSPAALSVTFDLIQPSPISLHRVPVPPFESIALANFALHPGVWENNIPVTMSGPNDETARIVNAVASGGTILPIQPPGTNASWQVSFEAPKLSCHDIEGHEYDRIRENIFAAFNASSRNRAFNALAFYGPTIDSSMFSYLAWMSWVFHYDDTSSWDRSMPFGTWDTDEAWHLSEQSFLGDIYMAGANLSIGVFPNANIIPTGNWSILNMQNNTVPALWSDWEKATNLMMDWYLQNSTLLNCQLLNANYTLQFTYANQEQHVDIISISEVPSPIQVYNNLEFDTSKSGTLTLRGWNYDGKPAGNTPDEMSRNAQRSLSYNALWQATLTLLLGASNEPYGMLGQATFGNDTYQTQVFSTKLMDTIEMARLRQGTPDAQDVTNSTSGSAFEMASSLLPLAKQNQNRQPLKEALEELFFNITVSIMSSPSLQYNESSPYAPDPVNVTFAHYGNIYIYEPSKLWIPYGIALGISVLNVICGFWAMFDTGASFTADFSTIARIVKNANIDTDLSEEVLPGKDPLEKCVGEARFGLRKAPPPRYEELDLRGRSRG